jgi:hypothetical protein
MKKLLILSLAAVLALSTLTGCFGKPAEERTQAEDPPAQTSTTTTDTTPDPAPTEKPKPSGDVDVDAKDANLYNTKENAAPLGQWVTFKSMNFVSDEYEPYYIRIVGVSRDQAEIQKAIDSYSGIMDFSLTDDQARDIEYGIVEYEIYYAPDYTASDNGIIIHSQSMSATALATTGFETDGGMTYIGVGTAYDLGLNGSSYKVKPGEIATQKSLFSILKNYDESEYVFEISWYDGEIVSENARELFLAAK